MPVFLGEYSSRGTHPEYKFKRAVESFLLQDFKDAELIIISDGCQVADTIYNHYFKSKKNVKYQWIEKQPPFGGQARQTGIELAEGRIICYLDADDIFGTEHLSIINQHFDTAQYDWVYYNDIMIVNEAFNTQQRIMSLQPCHIGTSCIAHKRSMNVVWGDRYGHDWAFIHDHLMKSIRYTKIPTPQYYVCHIPGGIDV